VYKEAVMTRITTNKNKSTNISENKNTIERRDFIKLGASGVVAGLAGCAAPGVLTPAVVSCFAADLKTLPVSGSTIAISCCMRITA